MNLIELKAQSSGLWDSIPAQNRLKGDLQELLLSERFDALPQIFARRRELTSRLLEWARANRELITRG